MALTVGLDFGTHQTKVCIEDRSDKLHPVYRFFEFADLNGLKQVILPSVVQINSDDTLSYGFVDESKAKISKIWRPYDIPKEPSLDRVLTVMQQEPVKPLLPPNPRSVNPEAPQKLYNSWVEQCNQVKKAYFAKKNDWCRRMKTFWENYKSEKKEYDEYQSKEIESQKCVFRYFKIASLSPYKWPYTINCDTLSICFLAYVILCLEQVYGQDFAIQMGIPTGKSAAIAKKHKAVRLLTSAYRLAEDVYNGDLDKFLSAKFKDLQKEAVLLEYSDGLKDDYYIKVLPEAYASLVTLTSRNRLVTGMNLLVDIGGGTTDISFFEIVDQKPVIYNFESLPVGINYIVENSLRPGVDIYSIKSDFNSPYIDPSKRKSTIGIYSSKLRGHERILIGQIYSAFIAADLRGIPQKYLDEALEHRPLVYTGGGSMYDVLCSPMYNFSEVHTMGPNDWTGLSVEKFNQLKNLCPVLSVALGLSIATDSDELKLHDVKELFLHLIDRNESGYTNEYTLLDD